MEEYLPTQMIEATTTGFNTTASLQQNLVVMLKIQ